MKPPTIVDLQLEGFVHSVELVDAKTGRVKRRLGPYRNLIVDAALDALGGGGSTLDQMVSFFAVGTDNAAPDVSQTGLGNEIARTNNSGGFASADGSGADYVYWWARKTRVFLEAEANGNLTEFGVFRNSSGGPMFARQLFLNELLQPTTITKTASEQLRITYEWRVYPNTTVLTDNLTIEGVPTECLSRAINIHLSAAWGYHSGAAGGWLRNFGGWSNLDSLFRADESDEMPSPSTSVSSGIGAASSSAEAAAYTAGNFYRDVSAVWEPAVANFATGIGRIGFWRLNVSSPQLWGLTTFNPKVPKTDLKRFTATVRVMWGRR